MIKSNSESFNFKLNFELSQKIVVTFENDIDLFTANAQMIKNYVKYRIKIYKKNDIQNTNLRTVLIDDFAHFIENH